MSITRNLGLLKRIKWPEDGLHQLAYTSMKREVETVCHISYASKDLGLLLECQLNHQQLKIVELISVQRLEEISLRSLWSLRRTAERF